MSTDLRARPVLHGQARRPAPARDLASATRPSVAASAASPAPPAASASGEQPQESTGWLTPHGGLDRSAARQLAARLDELVHDADVSRVVVDLTAVAEMDTGVPRVLLRTHRGLQHRGGALRVQGPSRQARRLLRWCGAEELLQR